MAISGNVPNHLVVGARSGFLAALKGANFPWQRVAEQINMSMASVELVDLGGAPMPVEDHDQGPLQDFVERALEVKPIPWVLRVGVSYNAVQDDQTGGALNRKVRAAAENFNRHINKRVFQTLNGGDGTTYGKCFDGLSFFNDAHLNSGGTSTDNSFALVLSLDNFQTNYNLAKLFTDESGAYTDFNYDLLVVPPALEYIAAQITGNPQAYDTANRENNPYSGRLSYITSPYMDSTAWACVASSESAKPLAVVMREAPYLQEATFDPAGPDGGLYEFWFKARYNVVYGDWHLAFLGNT